MDLLILLLQLAWTFFIIGLFTFGGGYAMLSLIQNEVVVAHGWLTESTFTDIVAISQMTPGPIGINCATYVGYDVVAKVTGSHLGANRNQLRYLCRLRCGCKSDGESSTGHPGICNGNSGTYSPVLHNNASNCPVLY